MPRQRRRRRRASATLPPRADSQSNSTVEQVVRPWWKPTLGIVLAFSLGLWLGGVLSVTDSATAVALVGGAIGVGLSGARLFRLRLYRQRVEARERRMRAEQRDDPGN